MNRYFESSCKTYVEPAAPAGSWLWLGKGFKAAKLADAEVRLNQRACPTETSCCAANARGRPLVLASATDATSCAVAEHLGVFSTLGAAVLSKDNKRRSDRCPRPGHRPHTQWAYAGNSRDDLAVWRAARGAV
jgi:hypothetical protein